MSVEKDLKQNWVDEPAFTNLRRDLLRSIQGSVLELGPGRGVNFEAFSKGITWTGLEPRKRVGKRLQDRAVHYGFHPIIAQARAENMPFATDTFDAVVASRVLCTVDDPAAVMSEVIRVLRPGGRYFFFEHVAPLGGASRQLIKAMTPPCRLLEGGCNPSRETSQVIQNAGFSRVEVSWHNTDTLGLKIPSIAGFAETSL